MPAIPADRGKVRLGGLQDFASHLPRSRLLLDGAVHLGQQGEDEVVAAGDEPWLEADDDRLGIPAGEFLREQIQQGGLAATPSADQADDDATRPMAVEGDQGIGEPPGEAGTAEAVLRRAADGALRQVARIGLRDGPISLCVPGLHAAPLPWRAPAAMGWLSEIITTNVWPAAILAAAVCLGVIGRPESIFRKQSVQPQVVRLLQNNGFSAKIARHFNGLF